MTAREEQGRSSDGRDGEGSLNWRDVTSERVVSTMGNALVGGITDLHSTRKLTSHARASLQRSVLSRAMWDVKREQIFCEENVTCRTGCHNALTLPQGGCSVP